MNEIMYVKATDLNRGKASACLKQVHDENRVMMVLKNSEPYAIIISIDKYRELLESHGKKISIYNKNVESSNIIENNIEMLVESRKKKD